MKIKRLFITTASWEDRFLLGARRAIGEEGCDSAVCFWFHEYARRTNANKKQFEAEFAALKPRFPRLSLGTGERKMVNASPSTVGENWNRIFEVFAEESVKVDEFVFDISTTPRESLWIILDLLTAAKLPGVLIYHRALKHGSWGGCDPVRPHIVPKLGGITDLDAPTKLVVISGFDEDRSEHFISYFEPRESLIVLQAGSVDDENKNQKPHLERFASRQGIRFMKMNSFSSDWGFRQLHDVIVEFGQGSNLLLASVGPKSSAATLYKIHRFIPNSSMVYSACREYSKNYSRGIGETLRFPWKETFRDY